MLFGGLVYGAWIRKFYKLREINRRQS
jgi:hypothetical protein